MYDEQGLRFTHKHPGRLVHEAQTRAVGRFIRTISMPKGVTMAPLQEHQDGQIIATLKYKGQPFRKVEFSIEGRQKDVPVPGGPAVMVGPRGGKYIQVGNKRHYVQKSMESNMEMKKAGGPYYGPKGGKYSDPQHKIAWKEPTKLVQPTMTSGVKKEAAAYTAQLKGDMKAALSKVASALGITQAGAAVDKFLNDASEQMVTGMMGMFKSDAAGFQRMATETLRKAFFSEPILEKALMADMEALEKAAFPPKKGKQDEAPPNNVPPHPDEDEEGMEAGDEQMGQVIGQTEDGKKVYAAGAGVAGEPEDQPAMDGANGAAMNGNGDDEANPMNGGDPSMADGADLMDNGDGEDQGEEGTHDHHKDKALAHLQAAQAHATAAHSAKKVEEAKEHKNTVSDASQASADAMNAAGGPGQAHMTGNGNGNGYPPPAGNQSAAPTPPGQPGQPAPGGPPTGGQTEGEGAAQENNAQPGGDQAAADNGPPGKDKKKPPFGKSLDQYNWAKSVMPDVVETMEKSMYGMRTDVTAWAGQFAGTEQYEAALKCLKDGMELDRKYSTLSMTNPTWSELEEMTKTKRDRVRKQMDAARKKLEVQGKKLENTKITLEHQLIDHKIAQAKRDQMAKAEGQHKEESLSKSEQPMPAQREPDVFVHKNNLAINLSSEDAVLKHIEDGGVIGGQHAGLHIDGRSRLMGMRGERLQKGTIFEGERSQQDSRAGDEREVTTRTAEFQHIVEADPAGNTGQGGLDNWFADSYSPHDPNVSVPVGKGPKATGWQKGGNQNDSVNIVEIDNPMKREGYAGHPQEANSGVRMLQQGGGRDFRR